MSFTCVSLFRWYFSYSYTTTDKISTDNASRGTSAVAELLVTTTATTTVPRTHNRFGDRSFAAAGPRLWNSLPISLRQISSFGQFRRCLKNHLFGIREITAQCDV